MTEAFIDLVKTNAGPIAFLMVASGLCFMLPMEVRENAIYMVIGAALTRVKRTDGNKTANNGQ